MKILAISGSTRTKSTNTFFLREVARYSPSNVDIEVFNELETLPVFNPDKEDIHTPDSVLALCQKVADCDGLIISSPEYIRSIPGGLKNAIDWLVSGEEIIAKPIALLHASHRGEDVLVSLRRVLSTVSENFNHDIFLQIPLLDKNEKQIEQTLNSKENRQAINNFITQFSDYIEFVLSKNK